ncbi:MAG: methylated-DNA--[protein]-cysteine S-methyltransferase [Dysgonamonadaceae bacterium]|jgi:methylated-DNA-[protein]-cysteine S-methyltransferase|nr:methylated-DNA--[protein]-cysteine S-methyltransferase [Dysgonamonadaceae bacterium]
MHIHHYHSPIGMIEIKANDDALLELNLIKENENLSSDNSIIQSACFQLSEYFEGKRKNFNLPLSLEGTEFQKKVWKELQNIPYGKTISYADLARRIGHPKAYRAVGSANGKNPIAIIIPCHRVITSDGNPGGYAYGLKIKKYLLDLENKQLI